MGVMQAHQLVQAALDLVGWGAAPPDTAVRHPGTRIGHVLIGLDLEAGDLFMARQLGYHAVIAYQRHGFTDPAQAPLAALRDHDDRLPSVARLLDLPFVTLRSPLDELGRRHVQSAVTGVLQERPQATLSEIRQALRAIAPLEDAPLPMLPAGGDLLAGEVLVLNTSSLATSVIPADAWTRDLTICCRSLTPADAERFVASATPPRFILLGEDVGAAIGLLPYIAHLRAEGLEVTAFSGLKA